MALLDTISCTSSPARTWAPIGNFCQIFTAKERGFDRVQQEASEPRHATDQSPDREWWGVVRGWEEAGEALSV